MQPQPTLSGESEEKLAVILMGVTGSGKSTFISLLARQDVEVGHGLESRKLSLSQPLPRLRDDN